MAGGPEGVGDVSDEVVDDGPERVGGGGCDGDADLADEVVGWKTAGELVIPSKWVSSCGVLPYS